jgi:hypothetical protein
MKAVLMVFLMVLSITGYAYAGQNTDSTVTATIWQGTVSWQGDSAPTQIYVVIKTDSSASIYSLSDGRIGKENGSWRSTSGGIELSVTKGRVMYSATMNSQTLTGTIMNNSNNINGTWNCTLVQGMTEPQLTLQLLQTSEQR